MRSFIVAANWKMHKTPNEAVQFFRDVLPPLKDRIGSKGSNGGLKRVVVFVPALNFAASEETTRNSKIELGGQNIHQELKGAFTGENSAATLKAMGAKWALVGHSERRTLFGETDAVTGLKMKTVLDQQLSAMLCVGETLEQRDKGETIRVVARQLEEGFKDIVDATKMTPSRIAIAYEPVWAIGTGKVASPEQASDVHQSIRQWLSTKFDKSTAQEIPILYGGSVKPDNVAALAQKPDIDGFLVGGASLEPKSFLELI